MGASKTRLGFLVLLLIGVFSGTSSNAHSLSCNFTNDPRPRDDQPWCDVRGKMGQEFFLSCDCGTAEIKYMSPSGKEVKCMNVWETLTDVLRDIGSFLKEQTSDITLDKHIDKVGSGPLTLQARMTCWHENNGHINGSRKFGPHRKLCLLFDSENGHWTVVNSKGRRMKEKWENDRAVTDFFREVSIGDCWAYYQAFFVHWERKLKIMASPTTGPPTVHSSAPAINHITWILLAVFTISS
ncbi:UL16-binding protein 1-like isoform X1 [Muntiacus reevesi]|uniref:UL16-binding protein 1-like isoform X1 n=1 Tax=Muntiacus reevesi TaxID=9886 RepID=UPI00330786AE